MTPMQTVICEKHQRHSVQSLESVLSDRSESEPGSSVSIVSDYGLDDRAIEVRYPAEAK
jgi:hypothetical protein